MALVPVIIDPCGCVALKLSFQQGFGFLLNINILYLYIEMKPNRFIRKSVAIILLLLFAQKIGVELYLHDWLHTNKCHQSLPRTPVKNVVGYSCNCIDDFSMPLAAPVAEIIISVPIVYQDFVSLYVQPVHTFLHVFNPLRAPPFA